MIENQVNKLSAIVHQSVFFLKQFPKSLPSGLGSTDVLVHQTNISHHRATIHQKVMIREQYPQPLPSEIGKDDLPGGLKKENVSGQSQPLYDLARGVVQIDEVKVLFNAIA